MDNQLLKGLLKHLDEVNIMSRCDGTLKLSRRYLRKHCKSGQEYKEAVKFLEDHGGFCDCEVLMNVSLKSISNSSLIKPASKTATTVSFTGNSLLNIFLGHINGAKDVSIVLEGLAMIDAICEQILNNVDGNISEIPQRQQDEIVEFVDYFNLHYHEDTEELREEVWGNDDALTLQIGNILQESRDAQEASKVYNNMSDAKKQEVDSLTDFLFNIRQDRYMTFCWNSGVEQMRFNKTISKNELQYCKKLIKQYATYVIDDCGSVVVRTFINGFRSHPIEVFGYRVNPFGVWEALSIKDMENAYLTSPTGERLEQEPGVTCVSRPRN